MKREDLMSQSPWCCGSLQTGAIAVGFTNLVSLTLLFIWFVQFILKLDHAFIAIIVSSLCFFVILVVNVCLIYGAQKRDKSMALAWLVLYGLCILGLITALSVTFHSMAELKAVAIPALFFLVYFFVVILAFYHELLFEKKKPDEADAANKKDSVLITLEENRTTNAHITEGGENDTFTCLMNRTPAKVGANVQLNANDPFLADVMDSPDSTSSRPHPSTPKFKASFLPQPDEVIEVDPAHTQSHAPPPAEVDPLLGDVDETDLAPKAELVAVSHIRQRSSPSKDEGSSSNRVSRQLSSDLAAPSSAIPRLSSSHSALVENFDTTFTPFKSKSDKGDLPKIKIFLPKSSEEMDDDDNGDSDSSDSSDNDEAFATVDAGKKEKEITKEEV